MPAATIADQTILKAILILGERGEKITLRALGAEVGMSVAGISRRVSRLLGLGAIAVEPIRLLPLAVDVCADRIMQETTVRWSVQEGELLLTTW